MLTQFLDLVTSRRVRYGVILTLLFVARWWLALRFALGPPPDAEELGVFVAGLVAWFSSESTRRHEAPQPSRRLLVTLLTQVANMLVGLLAFPLPDGAVALVVTPVVAWVLGEGKRRHEPRPRRVRLRAVDPEDAPGPAPVDLFGEPRPGPRPTPPRS